MPWVQRLKEKRIHTQVALDQVRQESPIETSTAEIIRHLALRSNPLLVCPQVESAKTHAEVLGIDPGAAEDAKARSFRQLGLLLHPDRNQGAPDRFAKRLDLAFKKANDAKDAVNLNDTVKPTRTEPQRNKDEKRREKQARARKAADDLSVRATAFQKEASRSVRGDDRSRAGITPWARTSCEGLPAHLKHLKNVVVQFVKVHATKVPAFGTILKTEAGSDVALLPTKENTLVLEAGCSSEKTRQFCTWMKSFLLEYPDTPVLCVTCRKTHADDLWATAKNFGLVFTNYLDAKGKGETKTEYMRKAKRLIVSLQSLHLIDLALYDKGILFMDEIRSIMSIPGGSTLPTPTLQLHGALRQLCRTVSFRVCMDADVSADGAVETALRIIARDFDVLHVQLQEPALKRRLCISFSGEGSNGNEGGTQKFQSRLKLWLLRVRWMGDGWCKKQKAKMQVASVVLWLLEKQWAKQDSERGGPPAAQVSNDREAQRKLLRKRSSAEDIVRMCALTWLLRVRERQWLRENEIDGQNDDVDAHREVLRTRLCQRIRAARYDRQRVLVCCGTPIEASSVADMCEAMGVRYHVYSGSTSDQEKRDHFKNTTDHWWEASVIIATSTMTVAVNVQIHFSVTFLWFRRAEAAGRLRELFQGLVRVARNEQDPLEDERIFMLMPGKMPDCSKAVLMRSQKQRFNDVLRDLKGLNTTSTECDKAAEELVGGSFVPEQEHLGDPLLELIAWNRLEGLDNCGDRALVKVLELCKLQTRGWSVELMKSLTDEDQAEREKLEKQDCPTHDEDDADRAEDRLVGQLSMSEKYSWLMAFFIQRAEASVAKRADELEDPPSPEQQKQLVADAIVHEVNTFVSEQEWLRISKDARPDKNAREIAKEKLFKLLEPIGFPRSPYELPAKVVGKLASDDTLNKLQWRAAATTIPLDEQRKMHEWMRRRGMTANSAVETSWHVKTKLLADLAAVLKLPIDRLLSPGEFTTEDAWVQVHNRRARGDRFHERADKTCVESVRKIATKMGAKVTFQMSLQTILSHVLSSVLKMSPSKRVEHKMECGAHVSKDGRATQLESWGVKDEWIDLLPKIVLPLLRPDGRLERSVKQQDWLARFEQLQNEAEENARQWDDMEVDEEEQLDDDLRAGGSDPSQPGPQGFARPPFNNYSKVEKYDVESIQAALADLEIDEAERGQCKEEVFNKLAAQRQQLGPADGFMAAGIMILAPNENGEKCVLLAKEQRAGYDKLNFIGGKCEGKETPCETAGRAAFEKCAGLFSQHDRDRFESDPQAVLTECWIGHSKYMLFVMELSTPSIPTLVRLELVPLRNLLDTNWTRSNLYSFCRAQLELVSPWLQKYLEQGSPPPPMTSVQPPPAELAACKERLEKLEQWYHSLLRCDGMHAVLENINSAAAPPPSMPTDACIVKSSTSTRELEAGGTQRESQSPASMGTTATVLQRCQGCTAIYALWLLEGRGTTSTARMATSASS